MAQLVSVPSLRGLPVVGNALRVPHDRPSAYFEEVAAQHPGGLYRMELPGRSVLFVYDPDLVAELCDESRFYKPVDAPLSTVRDFAGDGLFTARGDDPVWGQAHRILLPAFGQRSMKAYFPQMLEVAEALTAKWARSDEVNVPEDMTRLTLDTISLTGFGYRFDSFQSAELHPFLRSMGNALTEAMARNRQLPFVTRMKRRADEAYQADIARMRELVDEVIRERRAAGAGTGETDLLGLMLQAADPRTGERLSDANIRDQVLTFLIAGHETTSGLLSFAIYNLLRNPQVLAQAYAEVDRLLPGDTVPTYETIMKLDVIPRILDETLRIWSPIPSIGLAPREDTVIGGHYPVAKGTKCAVLLPPLHRHPKAWERPDEFDIDRWLPENKAAHHPHAYKPFGNGERACIGRQFALTEARLALALVLQRFAISDPEAYRMEIKQTLTIKPDNFTVRVRPRRTAERLDAAPAPDPAEAEAEQGAQVRVQGVGLTVAYGSNLGTSQDIAEQVADRARRSGFATTLTSLDALEPPRDGLLVVVAASYNGRAPDNAAAFDAAESLGDLRGLRFAVLGCGNTQWPTYQAFPRRVEDKLLAAGAEQFVPRGEADASADFDGDVQAWTSALWSALAAEYGAGAAAEPEGRRYRAELLTQTQVRPAVVSDRAVPLTVISNEELVRDPSGLWDFGDERPRPGVRSIVAELPEGVTYEAGNHLAVYAKNDPELVAWATHCLRLPAGQVVRLSQEGERATHLPLGVPVPVELLLTEFVELQEVATRSDLETLASFTECPWTRGELARIDYAEDVLAKRVSVLALLERFPSIALPLEAFLEMCGPIRPRFYSISSSPLAGPRRVRITVGLVDGPAWSGTGRYRGMCSAYLAGLEPGDAFYGYVRVPSPPFHLPADPATPLVLIGPGTGFAPLRGFLEERSLLPDAGPAKVFYGCRHPEHDWLYRDETWDADVRVAFSALPGHPHRYVQEALLADAEGVRDLVERGAYVYVCGDGVRMAPAVRRALVEICGEEGVRRLDAEGRYQQDVFGG
ncbi:bifunctional cytochrome P450/NADPH--P450 reductase [Microtetraspora malaysiensis]|uniref:bifunctional cytochrome P450/NADPH--P450 reductase n=1 Tax=Microtetraspora malaysiensis TaxID=161358 RepID=UPI003D89FFE5